jgi:hypothetical protein
MKATAISEQHRKKTKKHRIGRLAVTLLLALSTRTGFAATSATATNALATTLNVSVNVQTAVQLTIATGTGGLGTPCTVSAGGGGDFSISLGNINGLGVGTPTCGGVQAVTASNATYATNYQITPSYSGFTSSTATLTLTAPTFTHFATLTLVEGSTSASMTAVPTSGTTHQIAVAASGTAISRALGVTVSNGDGSGAFPGTAGASGSDSTLLTFSMTVP